MHVGQNVCIQLNLLYIRSMSELDTEETFCDLHTLHVDAMFCMVSL